MSDPRLQSLSNFTSALHHNVPESLDPANGPRFPSNYTVCIIGASEGIGEQIAYSYVKAGVTRLMLAARTLDKLEVVRKSIRDSRNGSTIEDRDSMNVEIASCDMSSAESMDHLAKLVMEKFGRLDVLIPNAAYAGPVTLKMHLGEPEWVQRAFDVNAMGTYHAAHYFVPILMSSSNSAKSFIAIGSGASAIRRGHIANTGYCVSKMAQVRLVEFLDEQYGQEGLMAVALHPGAVKTSMSVGNTPETFVPYLIDGVNLAGSVCVWLSRQRHDIQWLSGRYISANWDLEELLSKKNEITEKDLLKFGMILG